MTAREERVRELVAEMRGTTIQRTLTAEERLVAAQRGVQLARGLLHEAQEIERHSKEKLVRARDMERVVAELEASIAPAMPEERRPVGRK